MKKNIKKIVGVVIIVGLAFLYAYIAKTHSIYNTKVDPSVYGNMSVANKGIITQQFTTSENSLDAVKIKCRTVGDLSNVLVKYSIIDGEEGKELYQGEIKGVEFENSKFADFSFPTIKNTKNKKYAIQLSSVGETDENQVMFCYEQEKKKDYKLMFDGEETDGTMVAKIITNRFDVETFCVLMFFVLYVVLFIKFLYKLFK